MSNFTSTTYILKRKILTFMSLYTWHPSNDFDERGIKCTKSFHHKGNKSYERKYFLLLLPTDKRYLLHTFLCQRRRLTLVSNKTSLVYRQRFLKPIA